MYSSNKSLTHLKNKQCSMPNDSYNKVMSENPCDRFWHFKILEMYWETALNPGVDLTGMC